MVVARCILMYGVLERKISTNEPGPSATAESGFHSSGTIWSAARSCGSSRNAGRLPSWCGALGQPTKLFGLVTSDDSSPTAVSWMECWTPRLCACAAALRGRSSPPQSSAHVERLASSTLTSKWRTEVGIAC